MCGQSMPFWAILLAQIVQEGRDQDHHPDSEDHIRQANRAKQTSRQRIMRGGLDFDPDLRQLHDFHLEFA